MQRISAVLASRARLTVRAAGPRAPGAGWALGAGAGLVWVLASSWAGAGPWSVTSERLGMPILPATPYTTFFTGLPPGVQLVGLSIAATNGDFNSADETLTVSVNDVRLGRPRPLSIGNHDIETTLLLEFDEHELAAHFAGFEPHLRPVQGTIKVRVTPSRRVDQSYGAPFNPSTETTSHFQVTLHLVPEPAGSAAWLASWAGGWGLWRRRDRRRSLTSAVARNS